MRLFTRLSLIVTIMLAAFASHSQTITVTANHGDTICAGTNVFFHASTTDTVGTRYKWQLNHTTVGGTMPFYGNNALVTGDTVFCYLTNFAGDTILATSNYHIMTVNASVHPSPITGGDSVCVGGTLALMDSVSGGVWHSSNPGVFTVDSATGVITGIAPGMGMTRVVYTITTGNCPDSVGLRIRVNVPAGPLMGPSVVCMDSFFIVRDTARGGMWTSSDATIADLAGGFGGIFQAFQVGNVVIRYAVANACGSYSDSLAVSIIDCSAGVNDIATAPAGFNVYPNPSNGNFTINYQAASAQAATATVTNLLGQQIMQMEIAANKEYNVANVLAQGMYFITLRAGDNIIVKKVIVE